ncbi:MAG: hormogonium polysaccharide biosynthesis protein HpsA [Cyanobacteria bacterium P01_D01_bin.6]
MPNRQNSHKPSRSQRLLKPFMKGVFRSMWWFNGQRRREGRAAAGFVFPTTLLLVLMVLLTASALTFRTFSRSTQVISQREQQVIYNSATPAIDRAKAKLEFLFQQDSRLLGVPSSDFLANMMLPMADRIPDTAGTNLIELNGLTDPYTLPGETRLDVNGDDRLDNAWAFDADVNGDGTIQTGETAAYSILVDHEVRDADDNIVAELSDVADDAKADALVTRTGPLATTQAISTCGNNNVVVEEGWNRVDTGSSADIQKNFQITAFVSNNRNDVGQAFESLEFQQSRIASTLNKWGAWFRYDLGVFPGADFKWNGAMHTDGSLFVANDIASYMLTSHNSCLYNDTSSEITLGEVTYADGTTFQGQAVKGRIRQNDYDGNNVEFHLFNGEGVAPTLDTLLTNGVDSVDGGAPADVAMNPITLFLRDRSEHVVAKGTAGGWDRPAAWEDSDFVQTGRIRNAPEERPFVDDFYRADNRWGPKPRYDISDDDLSLEGGNVDYDTADADDNTVGDPIAPGTGPSDPVTDIFNRLTQPTGEDGGLDGYWERQAIRSGLRVIVGERLELGNADGWGYDPRTNAVSNNSEAEPLYPATAPINAGGGNANLPGPHEYRQHRSLRDNLAAVQGMVVYHYEVDNGAFPTACMAVTAHPGTSETVVNSRTFNAYPGGALATDFLTGDGTNGWEFEYPASYDTAAEFDDAVLAAQPLGAALRNLAFFAGDPNGGAPSFQPVQDAFVHPFPFQSMWGDFSGLRRIIDSGGLNTAAAFNALSPADQSTVHSAACTLSMLGYNLSTVETEYVADNNYADIATLLLSLVGTDADQINPSTADINETSSDEWIRLADAETAATNAQLARMRLAAEHLQVERDRSFGFATGRGLAAVVTPTTPVDGTYNPATAEFTLNADAGPFTAAASPYLVSCDPNIFTEIKSIVQTDEALTLALALCPRPTSNLGIAVKYPSLYYLFPEAAHGQKDVNLSTVGTLAQYELEPYIDATAAPAVALTNDDIITYGANASVTYAALEPGTIAGTHKAINFGDWILPTSAGTALTAANVDTAAETFAINVGAAARNLTMLDKGIFNAREQMAVRVLDIDIDKIVERRGGVAANDYWLPSKPDDPDIDTDFATEGILYAAREDAVREDEIVRPDDGSASDCDGLNGTTFRIAAEANCRMSVLPGTTMQDPPLQANDVSIKPVDFAPDPDRRAHGFRFRTSSGNPADFSGGDPAAGRQNGMTFVSDNTAYIQGNFNLHTSDGTVDGILEEFEQTIQDIDFNEANFYGGRTTVEDDFANLAADHWRPVEVLTDALTVLAANFPDGAIDDAFREGNHTDSSFAMLNRPRDDGDWLREDGTGDDPVPVWVDRNGTFYLDDGAGGWEEYFVGLTDGGDFITMGERGDREANQPPAQTTYVNATFVGGITPERPNDSYGGLHNYPRFLQNWRDSNADLFINGAFIQLNFSTSATGPYDQDAWEPGTATVADEWFYHYLAPERRWGFDVGLLFNPPGPAARRFSQLGRARSEYYRELPSDDPYVNNLRCAEDGSDNQIFPNLCNN